MVHQMLTFMPEHAISVASERECETNPFQGQEPQATLSLHNEPQKLRIYFIFTMRLYWRTVHQTSDIKHQTTVPTFAHPSTSTDCTHC
jgi:hypothetical protein